VRIAVSRLFSVVFELPVQEDDKAAKREKKEVKKP
jgi:hypothetical protein